MLLYSLVTAALLQAVPDSLATLRVSVVHDTARVRGANVRAGKSSRPTDSLGMATLRVPAGRHEIVVTRLGYLADTTQLTLRAGQDTTLIIELRRSAAEIERIVVSATRGERVVEDTPLRVEIVDEEEVVEKSLMTPGDVSMMMNETSGLRVAATAPSLGGANVRIQGLRGRYTLVLTDGLPLAGKQGSFGLLQMPPVDLARMEVIKGTASALYGPAALGGVINLVSRAPADTARHELLLNQTSRGGSDASYFASGRFGTESPLGATLLASANRQRRNDIDGDGWADLAGYERGVVRPRLFVGRGATSLFATAGYVGENRRGGTMPGRTAPDGQPFEEALDTRRIDGGVVGRLTFADRDIVSVRGSTTRSTHDHEYGPDREHDEHDTWFVEASLTAPRDVVTLVGGVAYQADAYANADVSAYDYDWRTASAFAQTDLDATSWLSLSASARADDHSIHGTSLSPRLSVLLRRGDFSARLSGGTGTFAPTVLVEEVESVGLRRASVPQPLRQERVQTGSVDLNGTLGAFQLNATLYASRLRHAASTRPAASGDLEVLSAPRDAITWGAEALARWILSEELRITGAYAQLRATEWDPERAIPGARRDVPLAPRHTASLDLNYERRGVGRFGLELFYTGRQALEDNPYRSASLPYLVFGFLAERTVVTRAGTLRVFVNTENLGGVRQTRWDPLVRPSPGPGGRWTTDAWTEVAGAVVNGGVRLAF